MLHLAKQLIKFSLVGTVAATVDFGSYIAFTRLIPILQGYYVAVSVVTAFLGTTTAYLLNRRWTFGSAEESLYQYSRYLAVYAIGIVWQNMLLYLSVSQMKLPDIIAKGLAIIIVAVLWNFMLAKFWVFRYNNK